MTDDSVDLFMLLLLFSLGLSKFLVVLLVSDLDWNRQDDDAESEKLGLKLDDEIVEEDGMPIMWRV